MTKFVIFTDNNAACFPTDNPFDLLSEGSSFGNTGRTVGVISFHENKMLRNPSLFIDAFKNYDILILADKVFDETAHYVNYIKAFSNGEQDIYVLIHKGSGEQRDVERIKYQVILIKASLGQDFENFLEQNHSSTSIYWNDFFKIANVISEKSQDQSAYQKLLSSLKSKFPDHYKEAKANLRSALIVLCKKVRQGTINTQADFQAEVTTMKQSKKLKLVSGELDKIEYDSFRAECLSPQTI